MRWKIIRERESGFGEKLEANARRLIAKSKNESDEILATIEREIAWVLDRIDRTRALQERRAKSLLGAECYTHTELGQMEARTPRYSPDRYPEREKLQRRLLAIDRERRATDGEHERELQVLQERLLVLLERHRTIA